MRKKKVKKWCIRCKKLTCGHFTLNRKSVYLSLICGKQIIIKLVQKDILSSGTPGFCKAIFQKPRMYVMDKFDCKLMHNISEKFSSYLQIPGHLLHFIPIIIDIIIFRQVDNKRFSFIIKYMVHDTKLFLFFNPNFQWIYFLYIPRRLSPQLLMAFLYRHSSDAHAISMGFNMERYEDTHRTEQSAFSTIESIIYCFSIFF